MAQIVIKDYELKSQNATVVVQSVAGKQPPAEEWLQSRSTIRTVALKLKKSPEHRVRLMAFSDGSEPPEEVRKEVETVLKSWKMAIIIHRQNGVLRRIMNGLISLKGVPAKCFATQEIQEVLTYLDLDRVEQDEIRRELVKLQAAHVEHLALGEFVRTVGNSQPPQRTEVSRPP